MVCGASAKFNREIEKKEEKARERNCVVTHVTKPIQCPKDQCSPSPLPQFFPGLIDKQEEKGKERKNTQSLCDGDCVNNRHIYV